MSYYGDGISYYYGGPFANHSSLMTGTTRIHTPLRFAPHLSTISESPLSTYRRYTPSALAYRPRKIIDTADIDVSTPRPLHSSHPHHGNRLRRDRPTIRIRSQALKDNPALRDHVERREKTAGELLVEKFLIRDKKASLDDIRLKIYRQVNSEPDKSEQEAITKRVTRRFTRRRSSADVQIDPEQLKREIEIAQVQAKVLDSLVAEEQAEIEVETRKGTFIHKGTVRGPGLLKKTTSESEDTDNSETKKKIQKKTKKRKKSTDKPSPPLEVPKDDEANKMFKVEACNSVGDFSTLLVNTRKKSEQFRESIKLPAPKSFSTKQDAEEVVILPAKKPYVKDQSRNSVYLTLKTSNTDDRKNIIDQSIDEKVAKIGSKDIIESDVEVKDERGLDDARKSRVKDEDWVQANKKIELSQRDENVTSASGKVLFLKDSRQTIETVKGGNQVPPKVIKKRTKTPTSEVSEILFWEGSQEPDFKGTHDRTWDDKSSSLTKNLTSKSTHTELKEEKRSKKNDECLVDVNFPKTQESLQQDDDDEAKRLPNSTVINLNTDRNEQNESRINESQVLSESQLQEVTERIEAETTVIENKTKFIDKNDGKLGEESLAVNDKYENGDVPDKKVKALNLLKKITSNDKPAPKLAKEDSFSVAHDSFDKDLKDPEKDTKTIDVVDNKRSGLNKQLSKQENLSVLNDNLERHKKVNQNIDGRKVIDKGSKQDNLLKIVDDSTEKESKESNQSKIVDNHIDEGLKNEEQDKKFHKNIVKIPKQDNLSKIIDDHIKKALSKEQAIKANNIIDSKKIIEKDSKQDTLPKVISDDSENSLKNKEQDKGINKIIEKVSKQDNLKIIDDKVEKELKNKEQDKAKVIDSKKHASKLSKQDHLSEILIDSFEKEVQVQKKDETINTNIDSNVSKLSKLPESHSQQFNSNSSSFDEKTLDSEVKAKPQKEPEKKLKKLHLSNVKDSSADSGIGSLELDTTKNSEKKVKKVLENSEGSSFECDEDSKLKQTGAYSLVDVDNKPAQTKLKNKLTSSKSSSAESQEEKLMILNSKKESILGEINSAEPVIEEIISKEVDVKLKKKVSKSSSEAEARKSPVLTVIKEENKPELSSEPEIDFWSEIKTKEEPKIEKPKITLKPIVKSASEPIPELEKEKVKSDKSSESSKVAVKAKKKKHIENSMEKEKKKLTDIIFDTTVNSLEDEQKHCVVKSSENSVHNKKSFEKPEDSKKLTLKLNLKDEVNKSQIAPLTSSVDLESQLSLMEILKPEVGNLESKDSEAFPDSVPVINISEVPRTIVDTVDEENEDEDDEDEGPKTPTNEEDKVLNNMSKWNCSSNLTTLSGKEMASSTIESKNEVAGSTNSSLQMSGKKKLGRRKKSVSVSPETTVIRKTIEERAVSNISNGSDTTLKAGYKASPVKPAKPVVATKPTNRPLDLVKMFYTTPASLLTATPRDLSKVKRAKIKRRKHSTPSASSDSTGSSRSTQSTGRAESTQSNSTVEDETEQKRISSTRSNDSGFDGSPRLSNCDMACHKKCEKLTGNLCGLNQKLVAEALQALKRAPSQSSDNQRNSDSSDHVHSSGRITPPATNLPRFKKYSVEDFNFLKVLGKGSFGKVLLAELRGTDCVYAVKCLKKDVVLEDDDVECTLIERKVLTLATRHPYLCHLFCTFQTDSHLFFVMEYLNGGDLMFHIQKSGRFPEFRAKFYAAEIWSGLNFLHKKGIVYRDLKLDNVLLDFEGHIRIADFGMCKLQIFLDRTADTFCGTPDYMAPEIIKGLKYNQSVDWWSFGVLLYEMLTGQSPFSGCDEDELFWSICNERPFIPRYLTQESMDILVCLLEKDAGKRPLGHEVQAHSFFHSINWDRLERRCLESPFKPALDHTLDTKYFDTAFTAERPRLTPVPEQILSSMDQGVFRGFSYTNPNATD